MKVLHLYKSYFPDSVGGVEQVIKNITDETTKLGCDNQLLTLYPGTEIQEDLQDSLHTIKFPTTFNVASCPFSVQAFRRFKQMVADVDLVHYHFPWPFAEFMHVINQIKKPALVTYHSDIVRQKALKIFYRPVMKKFLHSMRYIVPTSVNCMITSSDLKAFVNKCHVIPIGICKDNYSYPEQQIIDAWRQKVGDNFMLFIGVLRYYKGLHILLDAVKDTNIPLVIVGSGPLENKLKQQSQSLGLTNVYFTGYASEEDKIALLKLCRGVVVPSHLRSEAFCISLLEGLLFGKPLISTEIGTGTSFVNQDGVTGYVIEPNNIGKLREVMLEFYTNQETVAQMGRNARTRYKEMFTAAKMGAAYFELYQDILSG